MKRIFNNTKRPYDRYRNPNQFDWDSVEDYYREEKSGTDASDSAGQIVEGGIEYDKVQATADLKAAQEEMNAFYEEVYASEQEEVVVEEESEPQPDDFDYITEDVEYDLEEEESSEEDSEYEPEDGAYNAEDSEYAPVEDGAYNAEDSEYAPVEDGAYNAEDGEYESENGEYYAEDGEYELEEGEYYAEDGEYEPEEGEYYTEDGEYESEDGEYYAEDGEYESEDGEYYAEDGEYESEDGEYYAEDGEYESEDGEYYAEDGEYESEEGEYYTEDTGAAEDGATYYEESEYYVENADDPSYNEEEWYEEITDLFPNMANRQERKKAAKTLDRVMIGTAAVIAILAFAIGGIYLHSRNVAKRMEQFLNVGSQIEDIQVCVGEKGLLAVADAAAARKAAAEVFEQITSEPDREYHESEYNKNVTVALNSVSVQKDLKLKFTNQSTGKLIANVPFTVTVVTADKKTETWVDDDMDGIIYKKGITPGKYQVTIQPLDDEKYASYQLPTGTKSAEVKKDIAYQKIDVSNEVKTEAQVNVATEEQKKLTPVVESTLKDTVEWVESTTIASTYIEVAKSAITDPLTLVKSGKFLRMAEYTASVSDAAVQVNGQTQMTAAFNGSGLSGGSWTSDNTGVAAVDGNGVVTGISPGVAHITYWQSVSTTVSPGDVQTDTYSGVGTVTVTAAPLAVGTVSLASGSVNVAAPNSVNVQATASGFTPGQEIFYEVSSSDAAIATASVDAAGKVMIKGVAAGTATVAVSANYRANPLSPVPTSYITVTVTGAMSLTLDKTTTTVYIGTPVKLNATLAGNGSGATLSAKSSDEEVAKAEIDGNTISVTGLKAGTATITVEGTENGATVSATCAVTVKAHPKDDTTTLLKDNDGNQLYIQENDTYREAVYADYYKDGMKFFRRGDIKYTGWQTIDGRVYFFDAAGKKVTGEQVIQGAKYNFSSDGALENGEGTMGIDVSKHNGTIDWKAVKNSGVSYVIIRCGYRGYTQGSIIIDSKFEQNIKGATSAGLKVGVYFFSQAVDEVEAVEEASFVLDAIKGYHISYPIFLDVEYSGASGNKGRADKLDRNTRTAVCKAFCATIQSGGYSAGVYANKTWLESMLDPGQLGGYKIWLAQYAASPTYTGRYDMWQYKATGKVSGISGNVDMDLSYLAY